MAPGGRVIVPQENYVAHGDTFDPARPLVLWPYTNMSDPRFQWGKIYIQMRQDCSLSSKQHFGVLNKKGWCAYALNNEIFLKRHSYIPDAEYPDYDSSAEFFTMPGFAEVETLSPMTDIAPRGLR
ncbi:MAG: hypothetical protein GY750_21080 [Lentisphaerae bacterium]|nr:hypothetical protein [Lentisphaerota bacterium]MCP4103887.1 hypothetical protein [Lentisphaerota bacterium]